ncbi:MAG TPA: hypothetical protein VJU79_07040, partial [Candidatus Dormibacteraeota bacterium]|nr:hypothetical protein [Candidatus Dormibacteraeota bacterium]
VAGFIGSPGMNLVRGRIERRNDGGLDLVLGSQRVSVSTRTELVGYEGRDVVAGFRPEQFDISYNGSGHGRELLLNVLLTEALGSDMLAYLELDAPPAEDSDLLALPDHHTPITARLSPGTQIRAGERVTLLVDPARMHFFDPDTERAIT